MLLSFISFIHTLQSPSTFLLLLFETKSYILQQKIIRKYFIWCVSLTLESSQLLLQIFLLFSPGSPVIICYTFWNFLTVLVCSILRFSFFLVFEFQNEKSLLTYIHAHWFFPHLFWVYWWAHQKRFSFLLSFLISRDSLRFFLSISVSLLTLPFCSCTLCTFSH